MGGVSVKVAGIALAVLMLLASACVGIFNSNDSMDVAKVSEHLEDVVGDQAGIPPASRLKLGSVAGILGGLASVALVVVTFIWRDKVVWVAGAALIACAAAIFLYPTMAMSTQGSLSLKGKAMVALVLALLGALGALLAKRASEA